MSSTWFVTGASTGIGLEYVRQIIERGDTVFAAVHFPDKAVELHQLQKTNNTSGSIEIVELDVCDAKSVASAAKYVESVLNDRGLDYLINNADIINDPTEAPSTIKPETMMKVLQINVIGSVLVFQNFLPLLQPSKRPGGPVFVNIGSELGSIARTPNSSNPTAASYSVSKAALNMLTVKQALERPDIVVFSMAPGWVVVKPGDEELGGPDALYNDVDFSVRGQLKSIVAAGPLDSGKFKVYNGTEYPW